MKLFDSIYNPPERAPDQDEACDISSQSAPRKIKDVVIHHTSQLIELNILLVVTSLPILTLPIAWFAATNICLSLLEGKIVYVWHDFWHCVQNIWKPALQMGIADIFMFVLSGIGIAFYNKGGDMLGKSLSCVCMIICIALLLQSIYLPTMNNLTGLTMKQKWVNAALLIPVQLKWTLATAAFDMCIVFIGVGLLPYSFFIIPLIGVSLLVLVNTECARHGLTTYVVKQRGR